MCVIIINALYSRTLELCPATICGSESLLYIKFQLVPSPFGVSVRKLYRRAICTVHLL